MDVVTGAFGYIGRYITAQLLADGREVTTITTHVDKPNPFGAHVKAYPYSFGEPAKLVETLRGVETLYNTYWIRFEHSGQTYDQAVTNTGILFDCAAKAGVKKVVHISVTQASVDSSLPYYAGKGRQEEALMAHNFDYRIIRPTLVFGVEDILVNNIAWLIRKFPIFPIMGDGSYQMEPIYAADLAAIAVKSTKDMGSPIVDALGPESYSYSQFVKRIADAVGKSVLFVKVPPRVGVALGQVIGLFIRDVILTNNELKGLMENKLTSQQMPNGSTKFSEWITKYGSAVGREYQSELARHFRWTPKNSS